MKQNIKKVFLFLVGCTFVMVFLIFLAVVLVQPQPMEERLKNDLSLDINAAVRVKNVLLEVGIDEYTSIIANSKMNNENGFNDLGYIMNKSDAEGIKLYITEDASFIKVTYKDAVLYQPGMFSGNVYDHILTNDEYAEYKMWAEKDVKSILVNPNSADFPLLDGWKYGKIDGEIILQGYVDAQNAFGAVVRTDFQVKYRAGALVSLIFDGKEYVKR